MRSRTHSFSSLRFSRLGKQLDTQHNTFPALARLTPHAHQYYEFVPLAYNLVNAFRARRRACEQMDEANLDLDQQVSDQNKRPLAGGGVQGTERRSGFTTPTSPPFPPWSLTEYRIDTSRPVNACIYHDSDVGMSAIYNIVADHKPEQHFC